LPLPSLSLGDISIPATAAALRVPFWREVALALCCNLHSRRGEKCEEEESRNLIRLKPCNWSLLALETRGATRVRREQIFFRDFFSIFIAMVLMSSEKSIVVDVFNKQLRASNDEIEVRLISSEK
jgi:hypothetical protein